VGGIAEMILELLPEPAGGPLEMRVSQVTIDMPVEVTPQSGAGGRLELETGPPGQSFRTSVMPVFHRIALRAELVEEP
jgi:hypothetical protein